MSLYSICSSPQISGFPFCKLHNYRSVGSFPKRYAGDSLLSNDIATAQVRREPNAFDARRRGEE